MPQMTLDEILAGAKRALATSGKLQHEIRGEVAAKAGQRGTPERSTVEKVGEVVGPAAELGLLPLSFMSGPPGWIAAGSQAAHAAKGVYDNPGMMSGAMASLSALPFMKPAKALWKGAGETAKKVVGEVDRYMPNTSGATAAPGSGKRAARAATVPYQRPTPFNPAEAHMPNTPNPRAGAVGDDAALPFQTSASTVDRFTPNTPSANSNAFGEAASPLQSAVRIGADQYHPAVQALDNMTGGGALDDMVRQTVTEPMPGPFGGAVDDVVRGGADDVPNNPVARRVEAERNAGRELTEDEVAEALAAQADQFDNGAVPAHLKALDDAHAARMADWRQIPPDPNSKARFVKEHVGKSQQQMAQELGERDLGWKGRATIKRVKAPLYPSGDSKVDKLVGAMRQREKLMGFQD